MSLFSVPVVPLPRPGLTNTPRSVPVVFEGEHVADATLREGSYYFRLFRGMLETGLHEGTHFLRPKFRDTPTPDKPHEREYLAVEIWRKHEAM